MHNNHAEHISSKIETSQPRYMDSTMHQLVALDINTEIQLAPEVQHEFPGALNNLCQD